MMDDINTITQSLSGFYVVSCIAGAIWFSLYAVKFEVSGKLPDWTVPVITITYVAASVGMMGLALVALGMF